MKMKNENIDYILKCFEADTIKLIDQVLADDENDPEYSGVICSNRIVTLINVKQGYREKYLTIEEYLWNIGYDKKDILLFIESMEKEKNKYESEILKIKRKKNSINEIYNKLIKVLKIIVSKEKEYKLSSDISESYEIRNLFHEAFINKRILIENKFLDENSIEIIETIDKCFENVSDKIYEEDSLFDLEEWPEIREKSEKSLLYFNVNYENVN